MTPTYILIVALLTVESSYLHNTEQASAGTPDTVQFWFTPDRDWRVTTFATDHDIHVYSFREPGQEQKFTVEEAVASTKKHYGDVLGRLELLEFSDPTNTEEVARVLSAHKLTGILEVGKSGVAFYNPDNGRYHSQSTPE